MKKPVIISFIIFCNIIMLKSQELPYKPLAVFNNDTTAFVIYNFMERANCYKGKTIEELIKDLQIPISDFHKGISFKSGEFNSIYINIFKKNEIESLKHKRKDYNSIHIYMDREINFEIGRSLNGSTGIESNLYNYIKNFKIRKVVVVIPKYSKYYYKYNPKETKSQSSTFTIEKTDEPFQKFDINNP